MSSIDPGIRQFCDHVIANDPRFAVSRQSLQGVEYSVFTNAPPTLSVLYEATCAEFADNDFIVYHDERYSYAEANEISKSIGASLQAAGIGHGDPVAIAMRNYPEWILAFMAITRIGAAAVPMNGWWQTDELEYACRDSGAKLVIADPERATRLAPVADGLGLRIVCARGEAEGAESWASFLSEGTDAPCPVEIDSDDIGTIFYTSGSTGNPKGVLQSHRATINALMTWALLTTADRTVRGKGPAEGRQMGILMTVPLFHVTGCNAMFLLGMLAGQKIVLMDRWNVEVALELIEKEHLTAFNGVPSMSYELAQAAKTSDRDLSSLYAVSGGGAARPAAHVPLIESSLENVVPSVGYGLTESSALGTANAGANYMLKPGSVGEPCFPTVELRIVGEGGADVSDGESGEILLKSVSNMQGYLNKPDATAEVMKDGWLHTGDVGYIDEHGYLFIVDRLKDIVIRGGENISCQEVENTLYEHDAVEESAVFGLPDEKLGEQLVAVVYSKDASLDGDALRAFVKERLAYYKVPVRIDIVAKPLPRGATAKIYKRGLREAALAAMGAG
ncbi:MAG: class I adenylate-forming enzyme family protein [Pseudomonadota bacterium]